MRGGNRGAEQAFENGAGRSGHGWNPHAVSVAGQRRTWIFDLRFNLSLSFGMAAAPGAEELDANRPQCGVGRAGK
jgi:hypothetical protein